MAARFLLTRTTAAVAKTTQASVAPIDIPAAAPGDRPEAEESEVLLLLGFTENVIA